MQYPSEFERFHAQVGQYRARSLIERLDPNVQAVGVLPQKCLPIARAAEPRRCVIGPVNELLARPRPSPFSAGKQVLPVQVDLVGHVRLSGLQQVFLDGSVAGSARRVVSMSSWEPMSLMTVPGF